MCRPFVCHRQLIIATQIVSGTMNKSIEKKIVLYCLKNLLQRPGMCRLKRVYEWFEEHSRQLFGFDVEDRWESEYESRRCTESNKLPRDHKTIRKLIERFDAELVIDDTVAAVFDAFHISPNYRDALALRIYGATIPALGRLTDTQPSEYANLVSAGMAGISRYQLEKLLSPTGELVEKGLLYGQNHSYNDSWRVGMTDTLQEVLYSHCRTPEDIRRTILGKPLKPTLQRNDFDHITEEYDWMKNLLSNSVAKKERGVNILIYGKPGTGKTELAKTLCREVGVSLFGVSTRRSQEREGGERRSDLATALCLLQDSDNSALLMDEAEDVFDAAQSWNGPFGFGLSESKSSKSKLFFNRLLETNAVPVIWISNSIRGVDPAHLRRFTYALNLESPNENVQARIWTKSAKKNKVKISKTKIDELVKTYDIAPAIINASVRAASLTNDEKAIEKTVDSLQTAMCGRVTKKNKPDFSFSTALLNCDTDLENLTRCILTLQDTNFSLCLYGASGTGKSGYARYLADKMKMKVLHKRTSDLLGPYVGQTERNIADAFAEAKRKNLLLIFDEADSFLQNRSSAHRSWEVSQVNEMLTQMENHLLPFVCTTNLMDGLDKAALRRFTFKVRYDYLDSVQVKTAFVHFSERNRRRRSAT